MIADLFAAALAVFLLAAPFPAAEAEVNLFAYRASGSAAWAAEATRIARCESTWNPRAVGAAGERGLMQIHPVHRPWLEALGYPWPSMWHAGTNLRAALLLYERRGGWDDWSCRA